MGLFRIGSMFSGLMHCQRVSRPERFLTHWAVEAQSFKMGLDMVFDVSLPFARILSTNLARICAIQILDNVLLNLLINF